MAELSSQMQSVAVMKQSNRFFLIKEFILEYPLYFSDIYLMEENIKDFISDVKNIKLDKDNFDYLEDLDYSKGIGLRVLKSKDFIILFYIKKEKEIEINIFFKSMDEKMNQISTLLEKYLENFDNTKVSLSYTYRNGGELRSHNKLLKKKDLLNVNKNMFPGLDIDSLAESFYKSKENVLILIGEPGTGKTTLLKYLIAKFNEYSGGAEEHNVYCKDEDLLKIDSFWINLIKKNTTTLLLDDIDNILFPRDSKTEGNPFISQLLSYTNGLISNDTKIIITTNRTIEEIEPALLRDGRCFDILRLNKINIEENKDLLKKIIKDNHLSNELLKEENVSQAKIMNKINEKLDNNEKNYIIDKKISLKEAFILDKIRKRAGFSIE